MWNSNRTLLLTFLVVSFGKCLSAQVISEALLSFPTQTEYVEYDNLAMLRTLPSYPALRERFSGKPLDDAKAALAKLGIPEDQVREIVSGSSATAFYGLAGGTFSGDAVARSANAKNSTKLLESRAFCPGGQTCVVFLENSIAAFGTLSQLKELLEVRQGFATSLNSNRNVVSLLNGTDSHAPVRGVVFGGQLKNAISDMLKDSIGWNKDWSGLSSNVSSIGYSVKFDAKSHVVAKLECTSRTAASVLVQMLSAVGSLESSSDGSFQNLQVSSSGNIIDFKADSALPAVAH